MPILVCLVPSEGQTACPIVDMLAGLDPRYWTLASPWL